MNDDKKDLDQINKEIEAEIVSFFENNGEIENAEENMRQSSFQLKFEIVMTIILIIIVLANISIILVKLFAK